MLAQAHGRKLEAIGEQTALLDERGRTLDLLARCVRPVEQQLECARPQLCVARHRFVVKPHRVERIAEQHARHPVQPRRLCQLVLIAVDAVPAAGALVVVAHQRRVHLRLWHVGMGLVQPAGLRHADAVRPAVSLDQLQQRDLHGERQLALQAYVRRHVPEDQAGRGWDQLQVAR